MTTIKDFSIEQIENDFYLMKKKKSFTVYQSDRLSRRKNVCTKFCFICKRIYISLNQGQIL